MIRNFYPFGRLKNLLFVFVAIAFLSNVAKAQWSQLASITVTNNENKLVRNWQLPIYMNTAGLVAANYMQADGDDIRFSSECSSVVPLNYYIDSGMNTAKTKIWIKIDSLNPLATRVIYLFMANPAATGASTLATFNGPFSSTNQVTGGASGGVTNSQRGFRFTTKQNIIVSSFGKNEPNGSTRYVTLFDWNTQAIVKQEQVAGAAGSYSYQQLSSPVWLPKNAMYTLQLHQGGSDGYYFGNSSQINDALTYHDMRYCNGCTQNSFPNNTLNNFHYGYPDMQFYTVDTPVLTNEPTYSIGAYSVITADPAPSTICAGSNTSFSVATAGTSYNYQWQVYNGTSWSNASGGIYSGAATNTLTLTAATTAVNGYQYRCIVNSCGAFYDTSNAVALTVRALPAVTVHPPNRVICHGGNTTFTVTATGHAISYQWQVFNGTTWGSAVGAIYSGANTNTLTLTGAGAPISGYQYRCLVSGTCAPPATSNPGTLIVNAPASVTSHPSNTAACTGGNASFTVASGGTNLAYQWEVFNGTTWNNATGGIYSGGATTTLNITGVTAGINGYQYRCVVSNTGCTSATSNAAAISVNTAPAVTGNPPSRIICAGNNTTFNITATGTNLMYQWEGSNNGTNWNTLFNNSTYSGVNAATLNITNAQLPTTFRQYRCIVSNNGCTSATSNIGNLTVNTAPDVYQDPLDRIICVGQTTNFQCKAIGTAITYQWQVSTNGGGAWSNVTNGGIYSGATTFNLALSSVPVSMTGYKYRCVASGTCPPPATSNVATLTVNTPVSITSNPTASTTICSGGSASLSVAASGTGLTYKWYINTGNGWSLLSNGGVYSGATTSTLTITGITASGAMKINNYYCEVEGACNSKATPPSELKIHVLPSITSHPVNAIRCENSINLSFKVVAAGTTLSYQWQENRGSGWNNITDGGIYSGATTNELLLGAISLGMNTYRYRCVVTGTCGSVAVATSNPATLTVNPELPVSVSIATNAPLVDSACVGQSVIFKATPVNGGTPTYQWKKNNVNVGTGSTYTTTGLVDNDVIVCHMKSTIACPLPQAEVVSNPIKMTVIPNSTTTLAISSDYGTSGCSGKPIEFTAKATNEGGHPGYKWFVNGTEIPGEVTNKYITMLNHNDQVYCRMETSKRCATPKPITSNTMKMTINQTTTSSIVISPNPDSVVCEKQNVTMYISFTNGGTNPKYQWMLNGVDMPGETNATLQTKDLQQGDSINCRLMSSAICVYPEVSNGVTFDVNPLLDPSVQLNIMYDGDNTYTFTATPTNGGANPTYLWYRNGGVLGGLTGPVQTFTNLSKSDKIHVVMASNEECVNPDLLQVSSRQVGTGVSEIASAIKDLTVYPNPNTGRFTISGKLNESMSGKDVRVTIANAVGQQVYKQSHQVNGSVLNLPVMLEESMANGVYTVNIIIGEETTHIRFVLSR